MTRGAEFVAAGITATTVARLERDGVVVRLARGIYQLADAPLDVHHSLAEATKRVPKGVVALTSALAFHGVTDQVPRRVWMAIGRKDWRPQSKHPPLDIVRFSDERLVADVERHVIEGVSVPVYGLARTLADVFRLRRRVGLDVALEGLRETLRQRKATPAEIATAARRVGAWTAMFPYLEALAADV